MTAQHVSLFLQGLDLLLMTIHLQLRKVEPCTIIPIEPASPLIPPIIASRLYRDIYSPNNEHDAIADILRPFPRLAQGDPGPGSSSQNKT